MAAERARTLQIPGANPGSRRPFWRRFAAAALPYWVGNKKVEALAFLLALLLLLLASNLANVGSSYVWNYWTTALKKMEMSPFILFLTLHAALSTVESAGQVLSNWVKDKLQIRWRTWLTTDLLTKYLADRNYYLIGWNKLIDNPDERLHRDLNEFTQKTLSVASVTISAITMLVSYMVVLWLISWKLALVALFYALAASAVTIWLGKRLIALEYSQHKLEADYRYGLVHVRKNVESIAFYGGEVQESRMLTRCFQKVLDNFKTLIVWQRHMQLLKEWYEYLPLFLPVIVLQHDYFSGLIEIGVLVQAGMAFKRIQMALGVIPTYFSTIALMTAVLERIDDFARALGSQVGEDKEERGSTIDSAAGPEFKLNHLTLQTPDGSNTLIKDLSLSIPAGEPLLIVGPSGAGKSSLLRTIAGLWKRGTGEIVRPDFAGTQFLPQSPYMCFGSLREQLLYPRSVKAVSDRDLLVVLDQVNLAYLPGRAGGFDTVLRWKDILSVGEQQRLAFARLLLACPQVAFLDEATSALDAENEFNLYSRLRSTGATFVSVGHRPSLVQFHDSVLKLKGGGEWASGVH